MVHVSGSDLILSSLEDLFLHTSEKLFIYLYFFNFYILGRVHRQPVSALDVVQGRRPFVVRAKVYSGTFKGPCRRPPELIFIACETKIWVSG